MEYNSMLYVFCKQVWKAREDSQLLPTASNQGKSSNHHQIYTLPYFVEDP